PLGSLDDSSYLLNLLDDSKQKLKHLFENARSNENLNAYREQLLSFIERNNVTEVLAKLTENLRKEIEKLENNNHTDASINSSTTRKDTNAADDKAKSACFSCNKQVLDPSIAFIYNLDMFNDTCSAPSINEKHEACPNDSQCYVSIKIIFEHK